MNEKLNKFFKRITGKEIIRTQPRGAFRGRDGREQLEFLQKERRDEMARQKTEEQRKLDKEMRADMKAEIKEMIRRKLGMITTMDLDENFKLRPNYLKRRAERKAMKKNEKSSLQFSKHDWR